MNTENTMNELTEAAKSGGNRMTTLGVITIILGMLATLAPGLAGLSVVILLGILVLAGGIVRMLWAFQAGSVGRGVFQFALGGLTLLCGIALVANPLFGSGVMTLMLTAYFILDGTSEIAASFTRDAGTGRGWLLFGGIVSLLLGGMIWAQFPLSGAYAMGILLGIKLVCVGLIMIMGGAAVRSMAST